jgi:pimeloyl-ACP methyl ester carboxylesterase
MIRVRSPGAATYPPQSGESSHFGPQLRVNFDIVGFDPRGVGQSAPISCLSDRELDGHLALDRHPRFTVFEAGNVAASVIAGLLYTAASPAAASTYLTAWMVIALAVLGWPSALGEHDGDRAHCQTRVLSWARLTPKEGSSVRRIDHLRVRKPSRL